MRRSRNRNIRKETRHTLPPLMDKSVFDLAELEFHYLLQDLCVGYGFCISAPAAQALWDSKPATVDEFVDGLVNAEGLHATRGSMYSVLKEKVQEFIAARRAP